jgi:putative ABC transport system ATP-binding protein
MLKTSALSKKYSSGNIEVTALEDISIHIKRNEFVAIMGPSGSGKTTLMNILGCLNPPGSGSYKLDDIEISELDDDSLSEIRNKKIGFVFQTFNLQPRLTAVGNVMLPLRYADVDKSQARDRAETMLKRVGLENRLTHQPFELSGGQRQRALVNDPSIILADEPTGNLDSKTSLDIMNLFTELHHQGQTLILVTHDPEIAQHADKIIHMRDGKIEEIENVEKPAHNMAMV